jgi:hypothetical protein
MYWALARFDPQRPKAEPPEVLICETHPEAKIRVRTVRTAMHRRRRGDRRTSHDDDGSPPITGARFLCTGSSYHRYPPAMYVSHAILEVGRRARVLRPRSLSEHGRRCHRARSVATSSSAI